MFVFFESLIALFYVIENLKEIQRYHELSVPMQGHVLNSQKYSMIGIISQNWDIIKAIIMVVQ